MKEAENSVMAEALAAAGEIPVAPPKIPEGSTLIGIQLDRPASVKNRYMVPVKVKDDNGVPWRVGGMAVAIRDGKVIASNYLYARFAKGELKVTSSYYVTCRNCGNREIVNTEVCRTKDFAKAKLRKEYDSSDRAMAILREAGKCSRCGADRPFFIDKEMEKAELDEFGKHVLDEFVRATTVGPFTKPIAWNVFERPTAPVSPEWQWAETALSRKGLHLAPYNWAAKAKVYIFNPGFWLGWIDHHHRSGLFGQENWTPQAPGVDLSDVEGL